MVKFEANIPSPYFDSKEQKIIDVITTAGGDVFRTDFQKKMGGSNTTFVKKISSLKEKGIVEEYKRREDVDGRLKTAYRFTEYANRLFNVEKALKMEKWFSASQKIELFPEFQRIAQTLTGNGFDVYKALSIEPQHMFIETLLASSRPPDVKEPELREALTACNAFLQNIITGSLYFTLPDQVEGYIIFHYVLEKPKEELQRELPNLIINYITSSDPLAQHKAMNGIVELTIKYPRLTSMMTMAATNIAHSLKLEAEFKDLHRKYKSFKDGEEPIQLTRIQLVIAALNIFKKLHDYSKNGTRNNLASRNKKVIE